jgi:hypothetical protein
MLWVTSASGDASYALQLPDPNYERLWEPVALSLQRAAGVAEPHPWAIAPLARRSELRMVNTWACDLIAVEEGVRQPGADRLTTHWPLSAAAVEVFERDREHVFDSQDEEDGWSDADSLSDTYENDIKVHPTGNRWRLPGWERRAPGYESPPAEETGAGRDVPAGQMFEEDLSDADAEAEEDPEASMEPPVPPPPPPPQYANVAEPSNTEGPTAPPAVYVPPLPDRAAVQRVLWSSQQNPQWRGHNF